MKRTEYLAALQRQIDALRQAMKYDTRPSDVERWGELIQRWRDSARETGQ